MSVTAAAQYSGFAGTGNVEGTEGWVTHSGTADQIKILTTASDSGSSLAYTGFANSTGNRTAISDSNSEDINLAFSTTATSIAYASFLLKVTDASTMQPNNFAYPPSYFGHFAPASGTNVSGGFVSRLSVKQGSIPNTFNLGIVNTTGGTINVTDIFPATPPDYAVGTTYLIVLKYDMTGAQGQTSLFVNPVISASEPTPTFSSSAGTSAPLTAVNSFCLREATKVGSMEVDEVRLGSTWAAVVGASLAVNDVVKAKKSLLSNTLVNDQFKILTKSNSDLQIYSANGILVKQIQAKPNDFINVSELPKGIYVVKITENGKTDVEKIMKK